MSYLQQLFNTDGLESHLLNFLSDNEIGYLHRSCKNIHYQIQKSSVHEYMEGLKEASESLSHEIKSYAPNFNPCKLKQYFIQTNDLYNVSQPTSTFLTYYKYDMLDECKKLAVFCNKYVQHVNPSRQLDIHYNDEYIFRSAVESGNREFCEWLLNFSLDSNQKPIDIHVKNEDAFMRSTGHPEICKLLIETGKNPKFGPIDIHVNNEYVFIHLAINGHLDMCQWLFEESHKTNNKINMININANNDEAFRQGKPHVREWLISQSIKLHATYPNIKLININANNDEVFETSCKANDITHCKWLVEISKLPGFTKINIHKGNGYLFSYAFENGHMEMFEWLFWLSEHYHQQMPDELQMAINLSLEEIEKQNEIIMIQNLSAMDQSINGDEKQENNRLLLANDILNSLVDEVGI